MAEPADGALQQPRSLADLFATFSWLALQGFGGVLAVAQRVLCEQKRWLTPAEFLEMLSVAQILPGPNVCNLSLAIGDRFFGWRGAFVALGGMLFLPMVIVLALAAWFSDAGAHPLVTRVLHGMGIVAAGLIAGTSLKLLAGLRGNVLGPALCGVFGGGAFVAMAWLHWPLPIVLPVLGVSAWLCAWWQIGRKGKPHAA